MQRPDEKITFHAAAGYVAMACIEIKQAIDCIKDTSLAPYAVSPMEVVVDYLTCFQHLAKHAAQGEFPVVAIWAENVIEQLKESLNPTH